MDTPAAAYNDGAGLICQGRYQEALTRLDSAVAHGAISADVLVLRARAHEQLQQYAEGRADVERALQLDSHNIRGLQLKGMLAIDSHQFPQALVTFNQLLAWAPWDAYSLRARVEAAAQAGDLPQSLTYSTAVAEAFPDDANAHVAHARLLRMLNRTQDAVAYATELARTQPARLARLIAAAEIYAASGRPAEALQTAEQAVALFPNEPTAHLLLASQRPWQDFGGRQADVEAVLRLAPGNQQALLWLAHLQNESGRHLDALDTLQQAGSIGDTRFTAQRAIVQIKAGRLAEGEDSLRWARQEARTPNDLNTFCWQLATAGVELEQALEACTAAVRAQPGVSAYQDSLGLVLLRLGRNAEALEAYNHALQYAAIFPGARYGRAWVRQRLGDSAGAQADLAAARVQDAKIDETFASYGLRLDDHEPGGWAGLPVLGGLILLLSLSAWRWALNGARSAPSRVPTTPAPLPGP